MCVKNSTTSAKAAALRDNGLLVLCPWTHAAVHQRINSPSPAAHKGSHFLTGRPGSLSPSHHRIRPIVTLLFPPAQDGRAQGHPPSLLKTETRPGPGLADDTPRANLPLVILGALMESRCGSALSGAARTSYSNEAVNVYPISISLSAGARLGRPPSVRTPGLG
ncbi:hypothetical protein SKAU_G00144220 [Synaphobranchus kaupii]|uniref:Uncharacterized protein n=1 Tax=Synaphobranchus kaupii TaxID=118154 RepID=A0A9Q1FSS3_SYNKA|nr:hypothetical protein SKAU_G00144220 [Synaphobranchus kaupii]